MPDSSIVEFFNRRKRTVDAIVDQTFWRLMEPTGLLDTLFPVVNYPDRMLLLMKFKHSKPTIASIVAEEQELPIGRNRVELTEEYLNNLKIGKQYLFTARDFELMEKLETSLGQSGRGAQLVPMLEEYFFGIAAHLPVSIVEKHSVLTFQVALTGSCTFTDPLTKARFNVTYPGTIPALLPAALTTTARWGQSATADGLGNIETHATAWYEEFGQWPTVLVMRWKNLRELANQRSVKRAFLSRSGNVGGSDADVDSVYLTDAAVIDLITERMRGGRVEIFDGMYSEEAANGTVTDKYFLPDDTYFFPEPGNLERAIVPCVENNMNPGLYVAARVLNDAPRQERIAGVANGLPFLKDSRKIAARKVN